MVDCGVPIRRLESTMAGLGLHPGQLDFILVTHHHRDHTAALWLKNPLARKYGIPVAASKQFWEAWHSGGDPHRDLSDLALALDPGQRLAVGDLSIEAFSRPHDAAGSQGFVLSSLSQSLAVLTDLGHVPDSLVGLLAGIEHVVMEANHDVEMQLGSQRPQFLKDRVLGPLGHLSNQQAAGALARISGPGTKSVLLGHLSLECNTPARAAEAVQPHLRAFTRLEVAPPDRPSPWMGSQ